MLLSAWCVCALAPVPVRVRGCVCLNSLGGAQALNSAAQAAFVTRMHAFSCACAHVGAG